jgi:hypothetical protein
MLPLPRGMRAAGHNSPRANETLVRGRCSRDRKDSYSFVCSRGSDRGSLALSGHMTSQVDCESVRLSFDYAAVQKMMGTEQ